MRGKREASCYFDIQNGSFLSSVRAGINGAHEIEHICDCKTTGCFC